MEAYVIGIDLGTGSTKGVALNHAGQVIDNAQVSYPTLQPQPGYHEQDPEVIWQAFIKTVSRITASRKNNPDAICLSSAMHSVIPIGGDDTPLMNMMIWADNRSASIATRIHRSAAGQLLYEQTGTPIHAMSPLTKLQWLKEHEHTLFARTRKFISIKEFIWHKLFGEYEVDYSIASATGLFNTAYLAWNDLSMDAVGLDILQLSTLVNATYNRKITSLSRCRLLGVKEGTPVYIGASDGCLANIGSFATEDSVMALSIGTSGAVRVTRKTPMLNFNAMTFNYRLDDATYICGGATNNGGVILRWYAETFLGKKLETSGDYDDLLLQALAESPAGAQGLTFLPYVLGERAPIWSSNACGVFFGLRGHHRQGDMTRAVVEGISTALYDITQNMIDAGLDITRIHVSGGFVHSEQWLQILADIFGKKVCLMNTADASCIGAALLAMKHLGVIGDYADVMPEQITEFIPAPENMEVYRESFLRYRNLYQSVAGLMSADET